MSQAASNPTVPARTPRCRTVGFALLLLSVTCYMMLSAPTLHEIGIPYDVPVGPFPAKIHPGTYLLLLSLFVTLSCAGNPLREAGRSAARDPAVAYYLGSMLLLFVWVLWRHGASGVAFIIETLITPALMLLTLRRYDERQHAVVFKLMMTLLTINALMALLEYTFQMRLAPIRSGREDLGHAEFFRSSAFLGHPLVNALVTASLLPAVTLLPARLPVRVGLGALFFIALFAFGGRSAIGLSMVVYGGIGLLWLLNGVVRGRYSYLQITGGSVGLMMGLTALAAVVLGTGIAGRFTSNINLDDQSAGVRLRVWSVFDYVDPVDLWIGLPPKGIDRLSALIGLDPRFEAIENFWIYLLLMFGIIGFTVFLPALVTLIVTLARRTSLAMRTAIVVYLLTASTGNTLAAKDFTFLILCTAIQSSSVLVRRRNPTAPAVARPALGAEATP